MVDDIVPFLKDARPDLRKVAASTCVQVAATEEVSVHTVASYLALCIV
jgi:hypothetical protein